MDGVKVFCFLKVLILKMLFKAPSVHEILSRKHFLLGKFGYLQLFFFSFLFSLFVCLFTHKTGIIILAEKNPKCRLKDD